ncbi:type VI secretion system baseplate subunit TssF [Alkalisalibacterium limincola]|uniref:Type VI secretion system baseplate subunit TssF n=1 Tax=Alkalisalibacterium limincola TaxID=2699169 RepID=A0A5C8KQD7_9GAMM|nr:type VI secretion system baseplate subunit TssF [Alkalisalibacterium limincola]TXK62611.1 type VI secretion system baseplate subunit TssF [Alkalisalibacterium limincola]
MEQLLPYYERELAFLRRNAREFAERYPKIAGRLRLSGDIGQDPHVERLIESFALLSARVSKRIEDDFPEFTEALLEVLYPHYLRPFPSCSIACFDAGASAAQLRAPLLIERGTELRSRPVRGVACRFRTAYPVTLAPVRLARAGFSSVLSPPQGTRLPDRACAQISIELEHLGEQGDFSRLKLPALRVFVDGEPSLCAALRDALGMRVVGAWAEGASDGRWIPIDNPVRPVGFEEDEALLELPARAHPAYRLLTELFAFPEKFGFFDIELGALSPQGGKRVVLHLALASAHAQEAQAHLLQGVDASNLRLGCTPVVNLFRQPGEPIRLTHTDTRYPVLADARRPYAFEVHSVESVKRVRHTAQGEDITEFRPLYSLQHGATRGQGRHYWMAHRDEWLAEHSPGHELSLSLVDLDFDPAVPQAEVLSLELSCSNRDLPTYLAFGITGGDLTLEGGGPVRSIALLRKPTAPLRFARGRGAHWRLISQLSLSHTGLAAGGVEALRETMRLYDLPRSAISSRQIEGITGLDVQPATAWLPGAGFPSQARGMEVRLSIDDDSFVGAGLHVFTGVLERFLALHVHLNSFSRLVLVSGRSGEEILRCPARSGDSVLL